MEVASGKMWRLERAERGVIVLTIRHDAALSPDARAADMKRAVPVVLGLVDDRAGLVVDLSDAPTSFDPITHKALVDAMGAWDVARRRVAVVAGSDAIARLSAHSLVSEAAPRGGAVCATLADALEHVTSTATTTFSAA